MAFLLILSGSDKVKVNTREAIRRHLDGLKEDDLPIPEPSATAEYVAV